MHVITEQCCHFLPLPLLVYQVSDLHERHKYMSNRLFHGITVTHTDLEGKAERLNVTIYDSHFRLGVDAVRRARPQARAARHRRRSQAEAVSLRPLWWRLPRGAR